MQKLLLSIASTAILSLVLIMLMSQPGYTQKMLIGGRVGMNIADETYSPAVPGQNLSSHAGLILGGQFDLWFDENWGLSGQLLYDQKGSHRDMSVGGAGIPNSGFSMDETLNYLELPILAKVSLFPGRAHLQLFAGPAFGFLLSGSDKITSSGSTSTKEVSTSDYTTLDVALDMGAAAAYEFPGVTIVIEGSYALGLTNIDNTDAGSTYSLRSSDLRFVLGAMFPIN